MILYCVFHRRRRQSRHPFAFLSIRGQKIILLAPSPTMSVKPKAQQLLTLKFKLSSCRHSTPYHSQQQIADETKKSEAATINTPITPQQRQHIRATAVEANSMLPANVIGILRKLCTGNPQPKILSSHTQRTAAKTAFVLLMKYNKFSSAPHPCFWR